MQRCVCVCRYFKTMYNKTILDSVFVISAIIKVSVVISLSIRLNWQHLPRPSSLWISQKLLPIIVHCKGKHLAVTVTSSHNEVSILEVVTMHAWDTLFQYSLLLSRHAMLLPTKTAAWEPSIKFSQPWIISNLLLIVKRQCWPTPATNKGMS